MRASLYLYHLMICAIMCLAFFFFFTQKADAYFSLGTGFNNAVHSTNILSDGDVLVGGTLTSLNGGASIPDKLYRLNADGTPDTDTDFNTNIGTGFNNTVYVTLELSDGDILIGGSFTSFNGSSTDPNYLIRLNNDGTPDTDTGFNGNLGTGFNGRTATLLALSDDDILVGGLFTSLNSSTTDPNYLLRLNNDGSADTDTPFNANLGSGFDERVLSFLELSDNDILVGGFFTSFNGSTTDADSLIRFNASGTPDTDTGFNANLGSGFNSMIFTTIELTGGDILVGGDFTSLNGSTTDANYLVRLNTDGTVDTTTGFNTNLGTGFNSYVYSAIELSDGDVLLGGDLTSLNGSTTDANYLVRLNTDGTVDTTTGFNANLGTGFNGGIEAPLLIFSGGDILAGGFFTALNGDASTTDALIRLNNDGTVEPDAPPIITILGNNPETVTHGNTYVDAGATASDIIDGVLALDSTVSTVDTGTVESYTVTYTVTDLLGNIVSEIRTVNVVASGGGGGGSSGGGASAKKCGEAIKTPQELSVYANILKDAPSLSYGTTSPYVLALQEFLNGIGCTISKKGTSSPGNETERFSSLTSTALKSFQQKYKIKNVSGKLDADTRTFIGTTFGYVVHVQISTPRQTGIPSPVGAGISELALLLSDAPNLTMGSNHERVRTLQQFLNGLGYTVAIYGVGSKGQESSEFYDLTRDALIAFQKANNVTPAVGYFGPVTRELISQKYR